MPVTARRLGQLKRAAIVAAVALAVGVAVALQAPLCPTATLLHVPCPGCGLTRATLATLRGDFRQALDLHPLVWIVTPVYGSALAVAIVQYVRGPENRSALGWQMNRWVSVAAIGLLVLLLGVWISRFFGAFGGPVPVGSPLWR